MKTKLCILLAVCLMAATAHAQNTADVAKSKLLLTLKKEVVPANPSGSNHTLGISQIDELGASYHCSKIHPLKQSTKRGGVYILTFEQVIDINIIVQAYMRTGLCSSVDIDAVATLGGAIPNDTLFPKQWGLRNDGSFSTVAAKAGADIDMLHAWDIEQGDSNIVVAVLDAGCKLNHTELEGRIWMNKAEIAGNGIDDDNNGYIDDTLGWNVAYDNANPADDHGHGTHVAGIIGANANNVTDIAGVDQHCKLMIIKSADSNGFLDYGWFIEGIYYAADNGARIINISAGGTLKAQAFEDAVNYALGKGVTIVAAMMNFGSSVNCYPAAYPGVIAVGATDPQDVRATFSNFGKHISVCAPGHYIYSLSHKYDSAYVVMSGTSQATPHVTGLASLLLAQNPARTTAQLKTLIETNAQDMVGDSKDVQGWDQYYGYGRINAYRALTNAVSVKNVSNTDTWNVYPNPATDHVTIEGWEGARLNLYDITGRQLHTETIRGASYTLSLSVYPRGSYILKLQSGNKLQTMKLQLN